MAGHHQRWCQKEVVVSSSKKNKGKKTEEATSDIVAPAASFIGVKGKAFNKAAGTSGLRYTSNRAILSMNVNTEEPKRVWEVNSEDEEEM